MTFGEKIKAVRNKLFLSQQDFAKELGVDFTTVNRWENGHHKPNYKMLNLFDKFCKERGIVFTEKGIKE